MNSKKALVWLCLWAAPVLAGQARPLPQGAKVPPSRCERRLLRFYARHQPGIQPAFLSMAVRSAEKWLYRADLLMLEDTYLCMGHRESEYDPFSCDGHSKGVWQTLIEYDPELRDWWLKRGWELGPNDSLDTQAAFGVAAFYIHLQRSGGNIWGGVRRYNGAGRGARKYAEHIFISRRVIFGHPYAEGESINMDARKIRRGKHPWRK